MGGCGSAPPPPPAPEPAPPASVPFVPSEQPYLVDPLTGYSQEVDTAWKERLRAAHRALLAESDKAGANALADELLQADPSFAPAQVLAAQVELGEGQYTRVVSRLLPVGDAHPGYVASQLVLGRAAELSGDVPLAYSAFREIAARSQTAFQRVGELHPRAVEIVGNRLREALSHQQLDEADKQLALLRSWAPSETATFEAALAVAVARGDHKAELAAVKDLSARRPGDRALLERRAELELAAGDPGSGLEIIQRLAAESPKDPDLQEKLAAAKFRWRLSLLPRQVQDVAAKPEIDRADLADLLYWLIPNVRYARTTAGRIATDVLDHPRQEEIVRVVNLGLLDVDSTLHRFSPESPARRGTTLRSLVLVLGRFGSPSCLGSARGQSQAAICEAATACGLIGPEEDCRPGSAVTGSEAVEMIRRTLQLLGGS
jgi:hypothetical protein